MIKQKNKNTADGQIHTQYGSKSIDERFDTPIG